MSKKPRKSGEELPDKRIETLYGEIRELIDRARDTVYRTANREMVRAYWEVGRMIVEEEQAGSERAEYGDQLIEGLARRLKEAYGRGFNSTNLKYMRQFYRSFGKGHPLRDELSWTHYRLLLKVEGEEARTFYMEEAVRGNWSTRTLERQIGTHYYERMLASNEEKRPSVREEAEQKKEPMKSGDVIKDPYVLDFLGLKSNEGFYEGDLEQAIIDHLQDFLLELGRGFAFVGRQYRFTTEGGDHYYIDLVFYNYILKCFFLIDLKRGKLTHQDIGQMDMYVRYFEDRVRQESDGPTIGLVLCAEKDRTVVKYSALNDSEQLFASQYLPSKKELEEQVQRERERIEQEERLKSEDDEGKEE